LSAERMPVRHRSGETPAKNWGTILMRIVLAAIALLWLVGSAAAQPHPPAAQVDLPYPACGNMAALRANLTGTPDPTLKSDAVLRRLGVRCVGAAAPWVRPRY
jgi:hypothetical protein